MAASTEAGSQPTCYVHTPGPGTPPSNHRYRSTKRKVVVPSSSPAAAVEIGWVGPRGVVAASTKEGSQPTLDARGVVAASTMEGNQLTLGARSVQAHKVWVAKPPEHAQHSDHV